jgi:predicted Zn finger-like uncharacterized protein
MQTICPNCKTVFRLTETQLTMADGIVRCGVCHETFIARAQDSQTASPSTATHSDHDLLDEPVRAVVPEAFRHQSSAASVWAGLAWSLLIILLALGLVLEYAYFHRNQLQQQAELKPWLIKACALTHCKLEPLREPDKIEMVSRNVYSHPTVKNALMIVVTMLNQAGHEQPYPDVKIDFSNVRGGTVAARIFTPEEYLHKGNADSALLAAGTETSFTLAIQDPGKDAVTYEFSFL